VGREGKGKGGKGRGGERGGDVEGPGKWSAPGLARLSVGLPTVLRRTQPPTLSGSGNE